MMDALEQASRAFCRVMAIDPDEVVPMVATRPLPAWQAYLPGIRAAFEALVESPDRMRHAVIRKLLEEG